MIERSIRLKEGAKTKKQEVVKISPFLTSVPCTLNSLLDHMQRMILNATSYFISLMVSILSLLNLSKLF